MMKSKTCSSGLSIAKVVEYKVKNMHMEVLI